MVEGGGERECGSATTNTTLLHPAPSEPGLAICPARLHGRELTNGCGQEVNGRGTKTRRLGRVAANWGRHPTLTHTLMLTLTLTLALTLALTLIRLTHALAVDEV